MFIDDTIYNLNVKTRNIHFLPVYNANDFSNQYLCKNLLINQKRYNPSLYLNLHTDWCWMINFTRLLLAMIQNEFFWFICLKNSFFQRSNPRGSCRYSPDIVKQGIECVSCLACAKCLLYHCHYDDENFTGDVKKETRWLAAELQRRSSKILPGQCPLYNRFFS